MRKHAGRRENPSLTRHSTHIFSIPFFFASLAPLREPSCFSSAYPGTRRSPHQASFDSFLLRSKCRITVVLNLRRPIKPSGMNYGIVPTEDLGIDLIKSRAGGEHGLPHPKISEDCASKAIRSN